MMLSLKVPCEQRPSPVLFELNEKCDIDSWWDKYDQESLSAVNFFGNFLRDILLKYVESNIVIFIDEIEVK